MNFQPNTVEPGDEGFNPAETESTVLVERRFYVKAPSVNAVRRAIFRAPGGARVLGRHDRETIACTHTMDAQSFRRHWPILQSRMVQAGLTIVPRPESK